MMIFPQGSSGTMKRIEIPKTDGHSPNLTDTSNMKFLTLPLPLTVRDPRFLFKRRLRLRPLAQANFSSCAVTCAKMISDYHGFSFSARTIAEKLEYSPKEGTCTDKLERFLRKDLGMRVTKVGEKVGMRAIGRILEDDGLILLYSIPKKHQHVSLIFDTDSCGNLVVANHIASKRTLSRDGLVNLRLASSGDFEMRTVQKR